MIRMGDVWDRTIEFLGDNLGAVVPIALLAILIPNSISNSLSEVQANATPGVQLSLSILSIALMIVQFWGQLAISAHAIGLASPTRVATARLLPMIGLYVLVGIAFLVLAMPFVVIVFGSGVDPQLLATGDQGAMRLMLESVGGLLALYGLVFVVLSFWIAARFLAVLLPVIAAERRGFGAFGRSLELTRGLTWRIIGVFVLYAVVALVAVLAARTVFGATLRLLTDASGPINVASVITAVIVSAVMTALTVLATVFLAKLYVAAASRTSNTVEPA